jgi:hypothetical protein
MSFTVIGSGSGMQKNLCGSHAHKIDYVVDLEQMIVNIYGKFCRQDDCKCRDEYVGVFAV